MPFIFKHILNLFCLVHLEDGQFLGVVDASDEKALFLEAHDHVVKVLVEQVGQDILLEVHVELACLLEVQVEFRDDDRHEAVAEELAVVVLRDLGEVLGARLELLALEGGEDLFEVRVYRLDRNGHRDRHRSRSNHDSLRVIVEVDVARLDELEAVEEEVDALGVVVANLPIEAILAHVNTLLFVVLVDRRENRLVVVVDDGVSALLNVLGDVDLVHATRHAGERLFDPARVVADAGKSLDQLLVEPVRLTLEVAEVQVARTTEQQELALVGRVEDLEARRLSHLVADRAQRVAERSAAGLEASHDLLEVVEVGHERRRDVVGAERHVDQTAVVEGANVVDKRPLEDLEVDLGVLEDELVRVANVELLGERRRREAARLAVDATEALVEELPNRLLANPVVVVGVQGAIGSKAPVVAVEVRTDQRAAEVLVRGDAPLKRRLASLGQLVRLGVAEAEERVVVLAEDGANGLFDGRAELERLVGVDRVVRGGNDHVGPLIVEDTATLAGEVVAYRLEALGLERAEVGGDVRHVLSGCSMVFERWNCIIGSRLSVSIFY